MTTAERNKILLRLKTDKKFLINFLLTNNYPGVALKLSELGYPVGTPEEAYKVIDGFFLTGNKTALAALQKVPYMNNADNNTGGLSITNKTARGLSDLFGDVISGDWNAALGDLTGSGTDTTKPPATDPLVIITAQAAADKAAAAEQAASDKRMFAYILIFFLLIGATLGGIAIYQSNKKKKAVKE